ncbi:MAG: hypothetical protein DHS20C11_21450 [Lysobacteraceae bacterium]|nr:MAG: hypothetical protein DHS20C11_21450 [Xanthomonadaceae bacterium]
MDAQSNFLEPDISLKEYAVGAGYHHPISQNTDFVARAGWGDARRRFFSNDGFVASLALRSQWTEDRAETTIGLGYDDTGAGEEAVAFVSGAYPFNQTLGLSSTFKYGERGTSIFLGLRATF